MQNQPKRHSFLTLLLLALATSGAPAAVVVPFNSTWSFYVATNEASNPTTAWRVVGFEDGGWTKGPAPVGYDTAGTPGPDPIASLLPTSFQGRYSSVCFRQKFDIANPGDVQSMQLEVRIDDGFVAWLNGTEVGRYNVPAGQLAYNVRASAARETTNVTVVIPTPANNLLVAGANVIAIHAFNVNTNSTENDFVFDAMLSSSLDQGAPVILQTVPAQESTTPELGFIDITFDENVTGVDASDLLINGSALVTNVAIISPREYVFYFPEPPTGAVSVAFAPGHGIQDLATTPHPFAGASWGYTFDTNAVLAALQISEFMADNVHGISDDDGARSDWIEIYNPGPLDVNLDGWFLTDTETNLAKWLFPSVNLAPKKYMLVWASKKDRANPAAQLHTNFKLEKDGGYLALVDRRRTVVSEFAPLYPPQRSDVSYGRDKDNPSIVGFFTTPTPGNQNSTSGTGFAPEVAFSVESGIYTDASLLLTLSAPANTTIRYTTDGNVPATNSLVYTNSLVISNSTTLKARTFRTGVFPGPVGSRTFIMLDETTRDFSSKLPMVVISTGGRPIVADTGNARQPGTLTVIDTFRGRSSFQLKPDFQGLAEFEIVGQTSAGFPKLPYRIEVQDELRNDNKVSLLGMPEESDWQLRNPYSDKCLMNDFLAYELFEQMGRYSCRRRLVEVFVDTGGGKLRYPTDYIGVEVLFERIEVGKDRVDIAELTPAHTNEPAISGGYMFKKDKDSPNDKNFSTAGGGGFPGQALKVHEPKPKQITAQQVDWLTKYLNRFEASMYANNWTNATGTNHYSHYIDVDAFVDQHWIVEFPRQIDGYRLSDFFNKDRNGKVKPEPIWDWNLSFGNADYYGGGRTNGWYFQWSELGTGDHIWLRRLITGRTASSPLDGDPEFKQKIVDRWGVLRTNVMNGPRVTARIDEIASLLSEAAVRDFARFPRLGTYVWPNPTTSTGDIDYVTPKTYAGIISEMKKWVSGRYSWIETQFTKQPVMNQNGGPIPSGFNLALTAPDGAVYYTLDGSDPRAAGGSIAPGAQLYAAPVALASNARVFTRARVANQAWGWSPPTIATFVVQTPKLVITEIMYHPAPPPAGSLYATEGFEYIELQNVGPESLQLNGYRLSGGIDFTFSSLNLNAGERVVVVKNQAAFLSRYGGGAVIAGEYLGNLSNGGDHLALTGPLQEPILDFNYDDAWHPITDGPGFSLVIVNPNGPLSGWATPTGWRPSGVAGGSPGRVDPAPPSFPGIVINEILANTGPGSKDAIELYNPTGSTVDLGGWFLTDDSNAPKKFRIPGGTQIAGGGYRVFNSDDFNPTPGLGTSFGLDANGGEVYLLSGDALMNLTGYMNGFDFGASDLGVSFGRHVRTDNGVDHPAQRATSFGLANAGPGVGPVVISEIMFHPPEVPANGAVWDNAEDEFIELHNRTDAPVPLYDANHPANTWTLKDAVTFSFPTNVTLAARGYLLVVSFDPAADAAQLAAFRSRYGLDGGVPIYGPYAQRALDNSGASVELAKPGVPDLLTGRVPSVLVDKVNYRNNGQWPALADGSGPSLQRRSMAAYGNDPANWAAALPSASAPFLAAAAPTIQTQPMSQTRVAGVGAALFAVVAHGPNPLGYQWSFNGASLRDETNATLSVTDLMPAKAGDYQVVVMSSGDAIASAPATLTVLLPAQIVTQPVSQTVNPGASVILGVNAVGTGVLRYQWRFNGAPLSGETNPSLNLPGIQIDRAGTYTVVVTDDVGPATSEPATVVVKVKPFFLTQPESLIAIQGDNVLLSVAAGPQHPTLPLSYRWRKGTSQFLSGQTNRTLILNNVQVIQAATYSVVVTNLAGSTNSANAVLTVLADADGDHIPDVWEVANGFDPNNPADGAQDPDGDGFNNYQEYIAGTDPHDPASYLKVDRIGRGVGGTSLEFLAASNKTYSVFYTSDLNSAPWQKLVDVDGRPTNWVSVITDPDRTKVERYYRLVTPNQP